MSEELTAIRQDVNAIRRDINDIKTILEDLPAIREMVAGLQFRSADKIETSEAKTEPKKTTPPPEPKKEKDNKTNIVEIGKWCDIEGVLKDDPQLISGIKQDGDEWKLSYFRMDLPTQTVKVTLWGDLATEIRQYTAGEHIALNGLMAKEPYKDDGPIELSSGNYTKIKVLS